MSTVAGVGDDVLFASVGLLAGLVGVLGYYRLQLRQDSPNNQQRAPSEGEFNETAFQGNTSPETEGQVPPGPSTREPSAEGNIQSSPQSAATGLESPTDGDEDLANPVRGEIPQANENDPGTLVPEIIQLFKSR